MIKLKELKSKNIWDLNLDEIDYVYNNLHMNNYIYAALKMYHNSNPPLNKKIKIKKEQIPECLHKYAEKLIDLSPYLGNDDSRTIRINYKYHVNNLFRMFRYIKIDEIPNVMGFFAAIAYIPIIAEKNDNFELWRYNAVRKMNRKIKKQFRAIINNPDIDDFFNIMLSRNNKINNLNKYEQILKVIKLSIQIIIAICENYNNSQEIEKAWESMEYIMLLLEKKNNIDTKKGIHPLQIRYRNSLYLYGGDFFRRMGKYKKALEWYLKSIEIEKKFYKATICLTRMRTIERLLCAYIVGGKINIDINNIKELINEKLHILFQYISSSSDELIDYIKINNFDLAEKRFIYMKSEKDGLIKKYVDESSREFFLLALLYNNIINKIDYKDIKYSKFLDYEI